LLQNTESILSSYGNFGGAFDPTINVGAPAMVEIAKPTIGPLDSEFVEYGIFAAEKAFRNVSASAPPVLGRVIPNTTAGILSAPDATFQCARAKTCEIWAAKYSDSVSPSEYRRFTDPGLAARVFSSSNASSSERSRQATTSFIFSVSSRATAASFSSSAKAIRASAASSFCSCITAKVDTTTAKAAIAPTPKEASMMVFQHSRERPNIRLTLLEKVVFSICAVSCIGILIVVVLSIANVFKPHSARR